ncbi:ComF family protein [Brucepastera parasyntrophica]|uniref:ComF family protein n=1 Tax=Brucepastera parasyntrophica TaxID=2880008 RepID=UPI0021098F09|nr:ComF family protein [Brucepastera parasyntrophica]ULQ59847.1 ComF family protein [Brucepastera parasyntrophica]
MTTDFAGTLRNICAKYIIRQTCLICGSITETGTPLCFSCFESGFLKKIRGLSFYNKDENRCGKCGCLLASPVALCANCRKTAFLSAVDRNLCLFPYFGENRELLTLWKISGMRGLSQLFARCMAEIFIPADIPVVPVPPRPGKIREKGWDQIEEIAGILESKYHIPVCRCLERDTRIQQKQLGRLARRINIKGHISVKKKIKPPETVIVMDDLMTTGATLDACASALKEAGCANVYGLTLFFD